MTEVSQPDTVVKPGPADAIMAGVKSLETTLGHAAGPEFDVRVPDSGYRWWYVDGISDDGQNGIVVIAFIGSVFSPYYFKARSRGACDPLDYCAINVGLYRRRGKLWCMTERGRESVERDRNHFAVGPSRLRWDEGCLIIDIDERSTPFARPVRGKIVVRPDYLNDTAFHLDSAGRHVWQPLAPSARIEVELDRPGFGWEGHAYVDTNAGERALEDDFVRWNWSRSQRGAETHITYAVTDLDGAERGAGIDFDPSGEISVHDAPEAMELKSTGWGIRRPARSSVALDVVRTLEDTPFYARSLLSTPNSTPVMHESLALDRFRTRWVRFLLPFRMPRRA